MEYYFNKIGQADKNLSQLKIFDFYFFKFDLWVKVTQFVFLSAFNSYYMVPFLAKSLKPFQIFRNLKYLTFKLTRK